MNGSPEHPLADDKGQPIEVPEWSFPGRRRVQNQLRSATRALRGAERALQTLPLRGGQADLAARIEERREEAERALGYVELYGSYTETEAVFQVDRLYLEVNSLLSPRANNRSSVSTRPWWSGRGTAKMSTCLRSWPTRGCAWPASGANVRGRAACRGRRTGQAGSALARPPARAVFGPERTPRRHSTSSTPTPGSPRAALWTYPERASAFTVRTLLEAPRMLSLDMVDWGDFLRLVLQARYQNADPRGTSRGSTGAHQ